MASRRRLVPALLAVMALLVCAAPAAQAQQQTYPFCPDEFTSLGAFPAGNVLFDTTALTFNGMPGGVVADGAAVFTFDTITIAPGTTVTARGSRPFVLLSQGNFTVGGTVDVSGTNATGGGFGGPGGGPGGSGETAGAGPGGGGPADDRAGAGGGGFGGVGGRGGVGDTGDVPGAGGPSYGNLTLALQGGSGGGGGGGATGATNLAPGGGGGGGVFLGAAGTLSVTGLIDAEGGTGAVSNLGGSGGGSGGGVVLTADVVTVSGTVDASGGHGGDGGCCAGAGGGGAGGRVLVESTGGPSVVTGTIDVAGGITGVSVGRPGMNGGAGVVQIDPGVFQPCGPTADVSVAKTDSPDPVTVGNLVTYQITVSNAGPSVATNVRVTDPVPPGSTFVSASVPPASGGSVSLTPGAVTFTFPTLAAGASVVAQLQVVAEAPGVLTNTATVTSDTPDANLTNNVDTETTEVRAAADVSVTKTAAPSTVTQGRDITYTVTVANAGSQAAMNVVLTDVLPPGVALRTPLPPGCTAVDGTATCNVGTVNAGASLVYTFVVRTQTAGSKTNTATVTSTTTDANPANNTATATTLVTPDLTPPICVVVSLGANQVVVVAQDVDTGLASITPIAPTANVVVSGNTAFTPGTQAQVTVTGTRINRTRAFALQLRVTDVAGLSTTCDPVLATLRVTRADRPTVRSYAGIPRVEHKLTIKALKPGLTRAVISANGHRFVVNLRGKRIARLSIARALTHGRNNTVTIKLYGARGAAALVALTD